MSQVSTKGKKTDGEKVWIDDLEIEDAQIKWPFSHFDGRKDTFNDEGDHNFTVILPEDVAEALMEIPDGWSIKKFEGREEGDPAEYTLKVKISYKYEQPPIYFLKGTRRYRANQEDLADIKRSTCERIDVIVSPSRWVSPKGETGVTGYVKEMYVQIRESRFAEMYADYEDADGGAAPDVDGADES